MRRTLHGPDRKFFLLHSFLRRDQGFGAQTYVEQADIRQRLNAAYLVSEKKVIADKVRAGANASADFLMAD